VVASLGHCVTVGLQFIELEELVIIATRIFHFLGGTKCQEVVKRIETFGESIEKISSV
jgi:hypothetical protein